MQKLTEAHGVPTTLRALRFLSIRVRSHPQALPFKAAVEAARTQLKADDDAWEEAQEMRVAATADLTYRDALLDAELVSLGLQARALVNNKVTDERYMRLLPSTPAKAAEGVVDDVQNRFVAHVVSQLENGTDFPSLKPQAAVLKKLHAEATAAFARREAAFIPENQAMVARRTTLMRAQRTYNGMFPQLQVTLGDSALAESFFRPLRAPVSTAASTAGAAAEDIPTG